jgi:glucokinase
VKNPATIGALDIGGTHVAAGRVDVASATVDSRSRVIERLATAAGRDDVETVVRVARAIAEPGIACFGVAVPGPFDYDHGVSEMTHKLDGLRGVDLRSALQAALAPRELVPIRFVNDAEAFLLGEWWAGAARGHARAVGITLGTGLGSAFIDGGEIVRAGAGVPPGGELYQLRFRGALVERTISRAALLASYVGRADQSLDVEHIALRARAGEQEARLVFAQLGTALGQFLARWLQAFEASCLVVGGSIGRSFALLEGSLRTELASISSLRTVTAAEQLDDAPLLGAAYYASHGCR